MVWVEFCLIDLRLYMFLGSENLFFISSKIYLAIIWSCITSPHSLYLTSFRNSVKCSLGLISYFSFVLFIFTCFCAYCIISFRSFSSLILISPVSNLLQFTHQVIGFLLHLRWSILYTNKLHIFQVYNLSFDICTLVYINELITTILSNEHCVPLSTTTYHFAVLLSCLFCLPS